MAEHPLRERLHCLRLLALYHAGRQAEALEAYRAARAPLVEAVGAEAGARARRLREAILRQDPALDLVAPSCPPNSRQTLHAGRARRGAQHAAVRLA